MTDYPKLFMTITELKEVGLTDYMLREIAAMPGSKSVIRGKRGRGGTTRFDTRKLDADIQRWKA